MERSTSVEFDDWAMGLALAEASLAVVHGDVPVGAVVIVGGEVVASRHNERERTGDPSAHAEVLALRDAAVAIGDGWRCESATVYVTLEPCLMCTGALLNARVARIVYGAADPKGGACGTLYHAPADPRLSYQCDVTWGVREAECATVLKDFFADLR